MILRNATTVIIGFQMVAASWAARAAETPGGPRLDSAMESDPPMALLPPKVVYSKKLKPLWLKALNGPEADLRREVAQMIARAHRRGMPGLKETAGPLIKLLSADGRRSDVRMAIARTLVILDAREAAAPLSKLLAKEGVGFAQVVEPALAKWNDKPIRIRWMARLKDGRSRHGLLQLAIRGLGRVREAKAADPLWKLIQKRSTPSSLRLDAGAALGRIRSSGLVNRARMLAGDKTPRAIVDRLIAASLLSHHSDEPSRRLLLELAVDRQPPVAALALGRLLQIDSALVIPIVEELLKNPDANVRMLAARALADQPFTKSVDRLGTVLSDPHPDVRRYACRALFTYAAQAELKTSVRETAARVLSQNDWRGQEQAALLMGALDHKPSAARLVALLDAPRGEARTAAAWALRKLAISATLPAMLARAIRIADKRTPEFAGVNDEQMVQLLQAFGQRKYKPAIDVMWRLIPKMSPFTPRQRVAAIWALGQTDVGARRRELSRLLQARLADDASIPPEDTKVRVMSAVTLGRMKAADSLARLREFYKKESLQSVVRFACRWAIQRITGEKLPGHVRLVIEAGGWRLAPLPVSPPE